MSNMPNKPIPTRRDSELSDKPPSRSSSTGPSIQKGGCGNSGNAPSKPPSTTNSRSNTPDLDGKRRELKHIHEAYQDWDHVADYEQIKDIFILDQKAIVNIRNTENAIKARINDFMKNKSLKVMFKGDNLPFDNHRRWDTIMRDPRFGKFPSEMDADDKEQLRELVKQEITFLRFTESQLERIYAERVTAVEGNEYFEPLPFNIGTRPATSTLIPLDKKTSAGASK